MEQGEDEWAFGSIVDALPFVAKDGMSALVLQLIIFEGLVILLGLYYQLYEAMIFGTVTVIIATVGSGLMLDISERLDSVQLPDGYRNLLFGGGFDVVLGVVATCAILTYVLAYDPRDGVRLVTQLFGEQPPILPTFLGLILLWDACYRIGTAWWAAVANLWLAITHGVSADTSLALRGTDYRILGFGLIQLLFIPFLDGHPLIQAAVLGHAIAVAVVVGITIQVR